MPTKYDRGQPIHFRRILPRTSTEATFTIDSARSRARVTARIMADDSGGRFEILSLTSFTGVTKASSVDGSDPLDVEAGQTILILVRFSAGEPAPQERFAATLVIEGAARPAWKPLHVALYGEVIPLCPWPQDGCEPWSRTEYTRAYYADPMWSNWGVIDSGVTCLGYLPTPRLTRPTNVHQLARAIRDAEQQGQTVRALGSGWSFSEAALPQTTVIPNAAAFITTQGGLPDDRALTDLAARFRDHFGHAVDTTGLDRSLQELLPGLLREGQNAGGFFFVEAGMTLHFLNRLLDAQAPRLALTTLGGASGQTIAGAIATGTHGGDFDRPPVGDAVRALYVVGAGGVHHWIEPAGGITEPARVLATFPWIRPENAHYDNGLFRAALVSIGAMGVIYAAILAVVPQFSLLEWNKWSTWEDLKRPANEGGAGPDLAGVLDGSWSGIRGFASPNRFVQVVINPMRNDEGKHNCYVTNRTQRPLGPPAGQISGLGYDFAAIQGEIADTVRDTILTRNATNPVAEVTAIANLVSAFVHDEFGRCTALENELNLVAFLKRHGYAYALGPVIDIVMRKMFPVADDPTKRQEDVGYRIMTPAGTARSQPTLGGTSMEAAFEFPGPVIGFIDAMLAAFDRAVSNEGILPAGYASLRVTGRTTALLGMERFDRNGMVEVALLGSQDGYTLVRRAQALTVARGGTLHWGQSNGQLSRASVAAAYGQGTIDEWRAAQRMLGGDTFTNLFMERCGLATSHDTAPRLRFGRTTLDFGSLPLDGEPQTRTLTIANDAGIAASVRARGQGGLHALFSWEDLDAEIAPFDRLEISVDFTPRASGNHTGTLTITSNAPGSPHHVTLHGRVR